MKLIFFEFTIEIPAQTDVRTIPQVQIHDFSGLLEAEGLFNGQLSLLLRPVAAEEREQMGTSAAVAACLVSRAPP